MRNHARVLCISLASVLVWLSDAAEAAVAPPFAQVTIHTAKQCTKCGKKVPDTAQVGDCCPHCGVRWTSRIDTQTGIDGVSRTKGIDGVYRTAGQELALVVGGITLLMTLVVVIGCVVGYLKFHRTEAYRFWSIGGRSIKAKLCQCSIPEASVWLEPEDNPDAVYVMRFRELAPGDQEYVRSKEPGMGRR